MAWVYFDPNQKPLFVFIFYDKGGYKLFRNHMIMNTYETYTQVLKEIAKMYPTDPDQYEEIYRELWTRDDQGVFRYGLENFSYYSEIKIDKVLAPPTPESITAKAIQPRILGVPDIPKDMNLVFGRYNSTITGYFVIGPDRLGNFYGRLNLPFADIDWQNKGQTYQAQFDVTITFTNVETREKKSVNFAIVSETTANNYLNNKDKYYSIDLNELTKGFDAKGMSIPDLVKTLKPGDYEVKLKLLNDQRFSLKSGEWFQHITVK
jgi:hypothetical protein